MQAKVLHDMLNSLVETVNASQYDISFTLQLKEAGNNLL